MDICMACDLCMEFQDHDCKHCPFGNPCLYCDDYDEEIDDCLSNGACGESLSGELMEMEEQP